MPLVTNSTLSLQTPTFLCYYANTTNKMQLIRVWGGKNYSLEKTLFPQQRILFETTCVGILEVHTQRKGQQFLENIISCLNLRVNQSPSHPIAV